MNLTRQAAARIAGEECQRREFLIDMAAASQVEDPVLRAIRRAAGMQGASRLLGSMVVYARELCVDTGRYAPNVLARAASMSAERLRTLQQEAVLPNVVYALQSGARKRGVPADPRWQGVLDEHERRTFPDGAPPF